MSIYAGLIIICWIVFIVVWFIFAFSAKRNIRNSWWQRTIAIRTIIAVLVVIFFVHIPRGNPALQNFGYHFSSDPVILLIGALLCIAGISFAIWARVYLGRNWGMPMSLKENPELVTTGPYAYVRHPIYTGIILATVGSAITVGTLWLLPLLISCAYFLYSAPTEEKIMTKQFPNEYPAYKKRTKMLIPFVF